MYNIPKQYLEPEHAWKTNINIVHVYTMDTLLTWINFNPR